MTLKELQAEVYRNAVEHGFYEGDEKLLGASFAQYVAARLALMHSELSEALEEVRSGASLDHIYFHGDKPQGFAIELADCLIRILDCAEHLHIDMEQAVLLKHNYNRTRPWRHGGKAL